MKVNAFKLTSGEDVIAEFTETTNEYLFKNPITIAVVPDGRGGAQVGFAPFPLHSEQKTGSTIAIDKKHVIYSYLPNEQFLDNYTKTFSDTGIILPKKKQLIVE